MNSNIDEWIDKFIPETPDEERRKIHNRFLELMDKYKGKFYYRGAQTLRPEHFPPNDMFIKDGGNRMGVNVLLRSCPCDKCNHEIQYYCYIEDCECCSETCT